MSQKTVDDDEMTEVELEIVYQVLWENAPSSTKRA